MPSCFWCERELLPKKRTNGVLAFSDATKDHLVPRPIIIMLGREKGFRFRNYYKHSCYECNQKRCQITQLFVQIIHWKGKRKFRVKNATVQFAIGRYKLLSMIYHFREKAEKLIDDTNVRQLCLLEIDQILNYNINQLRLNYVPVA